MNSEFRNWLVKMYHENCRERDLEGEDQFESVDAYFRTYPNWLRQKFKEDEVEK